MHQRKVLREEATQAIYFPKNEWTVANVIAWLSQHGYSPMKLHSTDTQYRARLRNPKEFSSFVTLPRMHGVQRLYLVIGYR